MRAAGGTGQDVRRVLMLASGYPPDPKYPLRTVQFAKYLPRFGWEPAVLAPRVSGVPAATAAPGGAYRARGLPSPTGVWRWFQRRKGPEKPLGAAQSPTSEHSRALRAMALWLETPDALAGWIPFAALRGSSLVRRLGVRVVHASGPPFSVIVAGLLIARLSGRPLVADFRDAWVLDDSDPFGALHGSFTAPRSERRVRLLGRLEERCVGGASAVLFTSSNTMSHYLSHYPRLEGRAHLILNGFDPADFTGEVATLSPPTIAHVGTLHDYQWPQVRLVLAGLRLALGSARLPADVRVCFVGPVGEALGRAFDAAVDELGLLGRVLRIGAVSHDEAVRWTRGSQLLLLLGGENRHVRLSKISEYVAAGRPLLALAAPGSATAADLARYGGRLLHEPSVSEVAEALASEFAADPRPQRSSGETMAHPHPLNRITEAEQLAAVLDAMPGGRTGSR